MVLMTIKMGPVEEKLVRIVRETGAAHLTLIDPDTQGPKEAGLMAKAAREGGTDAIMVGGSIGASGTALEETVRAAKNESGLPIILFPGNAGGLCRNADAVFFMSLLNSRSVSYLIENQALGAPLVFKYGLEPLPMAYIVVEPGGTVGWVGDAKKIPRNKPELAMAYSLAGKYMGMRLVYLEAGSGAKEPVPLNMIAGVKKVLNETLLIAGGGIRSGEAARAFVDAGADLIVTGTGVERSEDVTAFVQEIVEAIKVR